MNYSGIENIPISRRREIIKNLSEAELWPLIGSIIIKLGFKWVDITHGRDEHGRDLVGSALTNTGGNELVGFVVKADSISGGVSNNTTLIRVMDQVKLAFSAKYLGANVRNPERINRIIVVTNKNISNTAKVEISSLDIPYGSIEFWQLEELEEKITKLVPSFYLKIKPELYEYLIALRQECDRVKDIQRSIHFSKEKKLSDIFVVLPIMEIKRGKFLSIKGKKEKKKNKSKVFDDLPEPVMIEDEDLLNPHKNYILVGEPGSGKTCLLRQTCIRLVENILAGDSTLPIPLFLNARELDNLPKELNIDFILNKIFCSANFRTAFNDEFPDDNKYTLFVDGLDELSLDSTRSQLYDFMIKVSSDFKSLHIILTSRPLQMWREGTTGNFQEGAILPIQHSAMADLLEKLVSKPKKSAAILKELINSEIFRKLPRTPLVVTLIALLHEEEELPELPANLADLYELFCMVYLERWTKKGQKYFDTKIAILELLALELHNRRTTDLLISDLHSITKKYLSKKGTLQSSEIFVTELVKENLLLLCNNSDHSYKINDGCALSLNENICHEKCSVSFVHKSFQEFFVARHLKKRPSESEKFLSENFDDPWWGSIGMFFSGFVKDIPTLIQEVIKRPVPSGPISISRMVNLGQLTQAATQTDLNIKVASCLHGGSLLGDGYRYGIKINQEHDLKTSRFQLVGALSWLYEQSYSSYHLLASLQKAFDDILEKFKNSIKLSNEHELYSLQLLGISWALADSGNIESLIKLSHHLDESDGVMTAFLTILLESSEDNLLDKKGLSRTNLERRDAWLKSIKKIKKRVKRYKNMILDDMNKEAKDFSENK